MTSCGENLEPDDGGYEEDVNSGGRYKGELSYNQLLKHYKRYYYEDRLKSAKKWKNTMLAIGLSKYYHLNILKTVLLIVWSEIYLTCTHWKTWGGLLTYTK